MQLSIIIPTLNEAAFIGKTLQHIYAYADTQVEVIVVDGGSTDETAVIAQRFPVLWLNAPERGRAVQMNYAAQFAGGDTLFFLHADCLPPIHYCMRIRNALTNGFPAGSFRYRFDSDRLLLKWQARCIRLPFLFCRGGDQGLFVRKEAFDAAGGYKSHFVVMEDYDLIRTLRKQARFALLPDEAIVSARKYRHNAWLKVQIANALAMGMFLSGWFSPLRIRNTYFALLKHPKAE